MNKDVLQKAVEALNHIVRRLQMDIDDGGRPDQWSMEDLVRKAQPAIDALVAALQQPEQATEPAWGITPATLNRHVSPGITLGHELNRLRQYDAAALQQQEVPREPVATEPECKWPARPLKEVQVTMPNGSSAVLAPERAYFSAWAVQELENRFKTASPSTTRQPDLLQMLHECAEYIAALNGEQDDYCQRARALIARATGEVK